MKRMATTTYSGRWIVSGGVVALLSIVLLLILPTQSIRYTRDNGKFHKRYGDWAIVAGASEGLGAAWAEALCDLKMNVVLVARREPVLQKLAHDLMSKFPNSEVDILVQDLSETSNLEHVFTNLLKNPSRKYGLLVYNAAHNKIGSFLDNPLEQQYTTVDVNVKGPITLAHIFGNYLRQQKRRGGMVFMSSLAGEVGTALVANYAATKAWNTKFALGLAHELAPHNIDVVACVAGATTTPTFLKAAAPTRYSILEQSAQNVVAECIQAMGRQPTVVTGWFNKLGRFVLVRVVPQFFAAKLFSQATATVVVTNTTKKEEL
jgi:short-subunit dehydrogenase